MLIVRQLAKFEFDEGDLADEKDYNNRFCVDLSVGTRWL